MNIAQEYFRKWGSQSQTTDMEISKTLISRKRIEMQKEKIK
jgi:hypothetical protein